LPVPLFRTRIRLEDRPYLHSTTCERNEMSWIVRFLIYSPAKQLLRECAVQTMSDFGDGAVDHLLEEIDPGTPLSGRMLIWLIILEVHMRRHATHIT
jgi:hypothetical protein